MMIEDLFAELGDITLEARWLDQSQTEEDGGGAVSTATATIATISATATAVAARPRVGMVTTLAGTEEPGDEVGRVLFSHAWPVGAIMISVGRPRKTCATPSEDGCGGGGGGGHGRESSEPTYSMLESLGLLGGGATRVRRVRARFRR